jgi:hypothetical protein
MSDFGCGISENADIIHPKSEIEGPLSIKYFLTRILSEFYELHEFLFKESCKRNSCNS